MREVGKLSLWATSLVQLRIQMELIFRNCSGIKKPLVVWKISRAQNPWMLTNYSFINVMSLSRVLWVEFSTGSASCRKWLPAFQLLVHVLFSSFFTEGSIYYFELYCCPCDFISLAKHIISWVDLMHVLWDNFIWIIELLPCLYHTWCKLDVELEKHCWLDIIELLPSVC